MSLYINVVIFYFLKKTWRQSIVACLSIYGDGGSHDFLLIFEGVELIGDEEVTSSQNFYLFIYYDYLKKKKS